MSGLDLAVPGPTGLRVPRDSPLGWPCWGGSRNGAQGISKGHLHPPTQCAPPWGGSLALLLQGPGFSSCPRYCWHPTLCSPRPAGESKLLNKGPPCPSERKAARPVSASARLCPALSGWSSGAGPTPVSPTSTPALSRGTVAGPALVQGGEGQDQAGCGPLHRGNCPNSTSVSW